MPNRPNCMSLFYRELNPFEVTTSLIHFTFWPSLLPLAPISSDASFLCFQGLYFPILTRLTNLDCINVGDPRRFRSPASQPARRAIQIGEFRQAEFALPSVPAISS